LVLVVIWVTRSAAPSFFFGQPSSLATGSGIAMTTGLSATEPSSEMANCGAAALSRCSQERASAIQTSGGFTPSRGAPAPVIETRSFALSTAATSAGSAAWTSTATHLPRTSGRPPAHSAADCRTAAAMPGAAATDSRT
jgi:hypothetical protein